MAKQRKVDQIRPTTIEPFATNAAGSVLIAMGNTRVLCTASIASDLPPWLRGKGDQPPTKGWVTAEYNMVPGSTTDRKKRGPDSRGTEIQRLVARVLRAAVDLEKMPGVMITCDCDVLQADGGTRTASITGAWVALAQAINVAREAGMIAKSPLLGPVAAVSVGIVDGVARLDLDYELDSKADVDMNVAMNHKGDFIEVQGTGENGTFNRKQLDAMLKLAAKGTRQLMTIQRKAVAT
jgi:ribonuclease PH